MPTGRSYQSYLQLVPGVTPDNPNTPGNPAVRSGMNYSDIARTLGDNVGVSSDNAYYFDGINVTDPVRGTFGANLNTEIIQEQKVLTGGIPAEFVGAPGMISNVITKSGSNMFRGSANYFFQNSSLVSKNEHVADEEFSTKETAFTAGGPDRQGSRLVLRQLPLPGPQRRCRHSRHAAVPALGGQNRQAVVPEGHVQPHVG